MPVRAIRGPSLVAVSGKSDTPGAASLPFRRAPGSRAPGERPATMVATANPADGPQRSAGISGPMESDEQTARRFRTTVMPYLDDAYNLARYLTRNAQEADDIVQDASLRA